ncbi:MAG: FAD:protein FMN transferase, partial [Thalassolituus sp.]
MKCFQYQFSAMTTPCQITLYDRSELHAKDIAQTIFARTKELEKKYNFHNAASWLSTHINGRPSNRITLDNESARVLADVWSMSQTTQGLFDITVGTLKQAAKKHPSLTRS